MLLDKIYYINCVGRIGQQNICCLWLLYYYLITVDVNFVIDYDYYRTTNLFYFIPCTLIILMRFVVVFPGFFFSLHFSLRWVMDSWYSPNLGGPHSNRNRQESLSSWVCSLLRCVQHLERICTAPLCCVVNRLLWSWNSLSDVQRQNIRNIS